ncbi:MAG TPA: hypothetical protein V6D08_07625 [Candidatus Obscuribacterales bacterium]
MPLYLVVARLKGRLTVAGAAKEKGQIERPAGAAKEKRQIERLAGAAKEKRQIERLAGAAKEKRQIERLVALLVALKKRESPRIAQWDARLESSERQESLIAGTAAMVEVMALVVSSSVRERHLIGRWVAAEVQQLMPDWETRLTVPAATALSKERVLRLGLTNPG